MSIDTRYGRKSFWTIVARYPWPKVGERLRDTGLPGYVEGCHKHSTRELALRCERSKRPWYNEHIIVKVENGTEIVEVLTRECHE